KPGLVRTWIAQAYAFGSVFMVPHRQWCYTQELGTHWYHGKVEDFAYLYGFVREKAALLDGYAPLAQTAVLLTDADFDAMKSAAQTLAARNVPFALLYQAQAEDLPPTARDVYAQILTSPAVRETLQEEQLVAWQGFDQLPDAMKEQIQVQGAEDILVSIRQKAGDDAAPLVCHVLNQNYEVVADAVIEVTCTLSIQASLVKREIKTAAIHQPNQAVEVVPIHETNGCLSFEAKNLGLWAIVELN
ncbi:MAG: hypothetical protein H3C63_14415, partial [Candidatus Omnitrophica bacterium]|nr:hypothetical protein [Candidatus Omnitrophota bacterium]